MHGSKPRHHLSCQGTQYFAFCNLLSVPVGFCVLAALCRVPNSPWTHSACVLSPRCVLSAFSAARHCVLSRLLALALCVLACVLHSGLRSAFSSVFCQIRGCVLRNTA
eukprot:4256048-Lingulodinium_polyedra.AAC.1